MFNIVWLKRDLRLFDHEPLFKSIQTNEPTLLLFIIEPILLKSSDYSSRHWQFMRDCLKDMQNNIGIHHKKILFIVQGNVSDIFEHIYKNIGEFRLFSHLETGNSITYQRDKKIRLWCANKKLIWKEYKQFGVDRGRINRNNWNKSWYEFMTSPIQNPVLEDIKILNFKPSILHQFKPTIKLIQNPKIQPGGSKKGFQLIESFFDHRIRSYSKNISKPTESRLSCSRLSPHFAWGSLSLRYVYQQALKNKNTNGFNCKNFISRLHWHCHFIQKLESEPAIEFYNQNSSYNSIRIEENKEYYFRFTLGQTGIPMVDACVRCLNETGYLNFRSRALLVSFWTHLLWQPWTSISKYLASQFTDYEPGIHYSQLQMQASTVGYHTIRIYNPTKLAVDYDENCQFLKKWVPELKDLPKDLCIEPWKINKLEEVFYNFNVKKDYFEPIVDIKKTMSKASMILHEIKSRKSTNRISNDIMKIHVNKKGQ